MNHSNDRKLNDRKRKLQHEYKSGDNYFLETSMENYFDKNEKYKNSMYNTFLEASQEFKDESIED